MEYITKKCGSVGHPEISVSVADEIPLPGDWLCDFFESEVLKGKQYRAGETVEIGWMLTIFKEEVPGTLELWEPDFESMPINWTPGVTNTLRQLTVQRAVCEVFECTPVIPSLQTAAVVTDSFFNPSPDFIMERDEPRGADSGWLFRSPDSEEIVSSYKSLYEVALARLSIIPYLALPPGCSVRCSQKDVTLELGDRRINSSESDVLQRIKEAKVFVQRGFSGPKKDENQNEQCGVQ